MWDKGKLYYRKCVSLLRPYLCKVSNYSSSDIKAYFERSRKLFLENKEFIIKLSLPCFLIMVLVYSCSASKKIIIRNITSIFEIAENVRSYYSDKPDYWRLSTQILLDADIIPQQYLKDHQIILQGNIQILIGEGVSATPVSPRSATFDIVMPNLNKAQCLSYAEVILSEQQLLVLDRLTIHNNSGSFVFAWGGENALPVVKYSSKNFCQNSGNTIVWTLK